MRYVVDASVAITWYVDAARHARARALLTGGDELTAPDFVLIEIANIVWKKALRGEIDGAMAAAFVRKAPDKLDRLRPARPLLARALEFALALDPPVYNCLYLAAADEADRIALLEALAG